MERSSLVRWLLIGAALFLFFQFGYPLIAGDSAGTGSKLQPLAGIVDNTAPEERAAETFCDIKGSLFKVQLTSRGGVLKHAWLEGARYKDDDGKPIDLVTTTLDTCH